MSFRKQGTEAKVGPLDLRRRERRGKCTWGEVGGEGPGVVHGETRTVFIWRSQGRILVDYPSAFQVCPSRVLVSTDWLTPGQGVISQCSWPWVQSWQRLSGFAAFPEPRAETQGALDVSDVGQSLTVLQAQCLRAVLQPLCSQPL